MTYIPSPVKGRFPAVVVEALEGRQLLSASVGNAAAAAGPARAAVHAPPPVLPPGSGVTGYGIVVQPRAGQDFNNYLGDLTGNLAAGHGLRLSATINWGDGTAPGAGIAFFNTTGNLDVGGEHTYAAAGTYAITVTVSATAPPVLGGPAPTYVLLMGQFQSTAIVSAPIQNSQGGVTLQEKAGVPFTASVGTFPLPPLSVFNGLAATIDWGDGKSSAGMLVNGVTGTHTYAAAGTYPVVSRVYIVSVTPPGVQDPPPPHLPQLFMTIDSTVIVTR